MSDFERLQRAEAALRWIYENGMSKDRPDWVFQAIDTAFGPQRDGIIPVHPRWNG